MRIIEEKVPNNTSTTNLDNKENPWEITNFMEDTKEQENVELAITEDIEGQLLYKGTLLVKEIAELVKKSNCPTIPLDKVINEQTFTYENTRYLLEDSKLINEIQHIMSELHREVTYERTISKRDNKLLDDLLETINNNLDQLESPLIKDYQNTVGSTTVSKLILNVLNDLIRNKLIKKDSKFEFLVNTVATSLGKLFYDAIMSSKYIYVNINEFNVGEKYEEDKNKVFEFKKRDEESLRKLLSGLKEFSVQQDPDYDLFKENYQFEVPKNIVLTELICHLGLYCITNNIIPLCLETKSNLEVFFTRVALELGLSIIYFLEKINIIKLWTDNRGVPWLKFKENYEIICSVSTFYYKPEPYK